jgi:methionyl-tRNA formyltransferase
MYGEIFAGLIRLMQYGKLTAEIYNPIRAVSKPYPGAYSFYDDAKIIIDKVAPEQADCNFVIRDCGKIWNKSSAEMVCYGFYKQQIQMATSLNLYGFVHDLYKKE